MTAHAHAPNGDAFSEPSIALRLVWQETVANRKADYSAFSPVYQGAVGRIFRFDSAEMQGQWVWSMTADGYDISHNIGHCSGHERSPRRAAKCVEDAWFAAIQGSSLDCAESRNAYGNGGRKILSGSS
ncbi:MAG: hypothetical protein ACTHOP_19065 [Mesorhizobium sp.]